MESSIKRRTTEIEKLFAEFEGRGNVVNVRNCDQYITKIREIFVTAMIQAKDRHLFREIPRLLCFLEFEGVAGVFQVIEDISESLYSQCHAKIVPYLSTLKDPSVLSNDEVAAFLTHVLELYSSYFNDMNVLKRLMQSYINKHTGYNLSDVKLQRIPKTKFEELLIQFPLVHQVYINYIIRAIVEFRNSLRNGAAYAKDPFKNNSTLQHLCKSYVDLGLFKLLAPSYYETTHVYTSVSQNLLRCLSINEYLNEVDAFLKLEDDFFFNIFKESTSETLRSIILERLIVDNNSMLFGQKFDSFFGKFENPKLDTISFAYRYLLECNGSMSELQASFCRAVKDKSASIIDDFSDELDLIPRLLYLKEDIINVVASCLDNDELFIYLYERSFSLSLHFHPNFVAKKSVHFIHNMLCSGRINDIVMTDMIHMVESFMKLIQDKTTIQTAYHSLAATRLIRFREKNLYAEREAVNILAKELGKDLVYKLEAMMIDICTNFERKLQDKTDHFITNALVYSKCYWPSRIPVNFKLPDYMERELKEIEQEYEQENYDKKIKMQKSVSTAEISFRLKKRSVVFTVNFAQLATLLLFKRDSRLLVKDIKKKICIDRDSFFLESLNILVNYGVLKYSSPKKINETVSLKDVLSVNYDCKIKNGADISMCISFKGADIEPVLNDARQEIIADIYSIMDKSNYIDAAVVRIMKNAKSLSHMILLQTLKDTLEFSFPKDLLQGRIDSLVSREFIKIDSDLEALTYNYIE